MKLLHAVMPMDTENRTTLFDLPEIVLLQHILPHFAAAPHTILAFGSTCKAAHKVASTPNLWSNFCQNFAPRGYASYFANPTAWRAPDHEHLWIGLLLPYGQLLGRLWHSSTWPSGQLIFVDVEPPLLVARSIYYKTLNGGPFCHDVFTIELPSSGVGKAIVKCWRDKHGADRHESLAVLRPAAEAASARSSSSSSSSDSLSSDLSAGFILCCTGRCDSMASEFTSRRLASKPYAAVRQHFASRWQQQHLQNGSGSSSDGSSASNSSSGQRGVSSLNSDQLLTLLAQDALAPVPLPDVQQWHSIDFIHFISLSDMLPSFARPTFKALDLSPWLQQPEAAGSAAAASGTQNSLNIVTPAAVQTVGCSSNSAAHRDSAVALSVRSSEAGAAAVALTGLWRGTYGSHGVETVHLQLLQAPVGYNLCNTHNAAEGAAGFAADDEAEPVKGVLLSGLLGDGCGAGLATTAAAAAGHEDPTEEHQVNDAAAAAMVVDGAVVDVEMQDAAVEDAVAGQQQQLVESAWVAAAVASDDNAGMQQATSSPSASMGNSMATGGTPQHTQQQRSLLLVASKVTGDMNVPSGRVTFAVDLHSRCTEGAGALLQLPQGTDTDVALNRPGTRQLRVKERYRARAQIAFTNFQSASIIAAEMITFDDPDCLGLVWKRPVDSFSLFSRASQMPGADAATASDRHRN